MASLIERWFKKYFSDPEGTILAVLLLMGFAVVIFLGEMLAPVLAGVVIAYLLDDVVAVLARHGVRRRGAVLVVFIFFMSLMLMLLFWWLPLLSQQIGQLLQEIPAMVAAAQKLLMQLPHSYPQIISEAQIAEVMAGIRADLAHRSEQLLSFSLASLMTLFTAVIYAVLLPVLVFFFLKDKERILQWMSGYIPRERGVALRVWREMDRQIGNYIRGKFIEIVIVGIVSWLAFAVMGLNYATLLGALVGLSVIVPYVGAVVVTLPVMLIGYLQWGYGDLFITLTAVYLIIQALDGNVLVPLLFSEAVNLHPVAIIVAILIFGGFWGFWGVFFAIPLATLVKAVMDAWPRQVDEKRAAG